MAAATESLILLLSRIQRPRTTNDQGTDRQCHESCTPAAALRQSKVHAWRRTCPNKESTGGCNPDCPDLSAACTCTLSSIGIHATAHPTSASLNRSNHITKLQ